MRPAVAILIITVFALALRAQAHPVTVFLAGDSTCAVKTPDRRPETGWGEMLQKFFDPAKVIVNDRAQNGRSTRTFIEQGYWQQIINRLEKGDWVFVQFGHNDSAEDRPDRYTPPADYRTNLLRFISDVHSKGAEIVLLTPVVRRRFDKDGGFVDSHGVYPDIVRTVAKERKVALIDMYNDSKDVVKRYGVEGSKGLFLQLKPGENVNYPTGVEDNTHFNPKGADEMAGMAVQGIQESKLKLTRYLKR